jgi:hypothetical protein
MAGFSTWTALKAQLLDDFAKNVHSRKSYQCGETIITFRDFAEFKDMLQFVERRAAAESSRPTPRRTYAGQGGGKC